MKLIQRELLHSVQLSLPAPQPAGILKRFSHWSNVMKRDMKFQFFSPDEEDFYPVVYILPSHSTMET